MRKLDDNELWAIRTVNTIATICFEDITLHRLLQMTYVSWIFPDAGDTPEGHAFYFREMGQTAISTGGKKVWRSCTAVVSR